MAAQIEEADLPRLARAAGESGKPMPAWAAGKPDLEAAHRAGAGEPEPAPATNADEETAAPTVQTGGSPASEDAAEPAATRRARRAPPKRTGNGGKPKAGAQLAAAGQDLAAHPGTLGSDGGGLMLAIFAYPIVLAMLQHGPAGLPMWLKAKFLNQASGTPTSTTGGSTTSASSSTGTVAA